MNENCHKSFINNKSSGEILQKKEENPCDSGYKNLQDERITSRTPTYGLFYWFFYYYYATLRLVNDILMSAMRYWFPNQVPLPHHQKELIRVFNNLRVDRELHKITYSSEDDGSRQNTTNYEHNGTDPESMLVIVERRKENLEDNKSSTDTVMQNVFCKNNSPVEVASTSKEPRSEKSLCINQIEPVDELQMIDVDLENENELTLVDSDTDNDSIVVSYLRDKNIGIEKEGITLMSTKKKSSLLEAHSDTSLEVLVPSYPGSPRSVQSLVSEDPLQKKFEFRQFKQLEQNTDFEEFVDYLHCDEELLLAAESGDVVRLERVVKTGININTMDHLGRNALHFAVTSGNRDAVLVLLKAGIKINVQDHLGITPLMICLMRSPSWRIANMLFDYGAEVLPRKAPMNTGIFLQFVMMCIPTKEEERILRLLVEKGAKINDPGAPGGRQALHFAAMSNNSTLIKILLDLGADTTWTNHRNQTPLEVAATYKCKEAYKVLEDWEDYCEVEKCALTITHP